MKHTTNNKSKQNNRKQSQTGKKNNESKKKKSVHEEEYYEGRLINTRRSFADAIKGEREICLVVEFQYLRPLTQLYTHTHIYRGMVGHYSEHRADEKESSNGPRQRL